jgi:hypothetical protein
VGLKVGDHECCMVWSLMCASFTRAIFLRTLEVKTSYSGVVHKILEGT